MKLLDYGMPWASRLYVIAVILMDLDHFKKINDTSGHHVGDLVLQHVAKQIVLHSPADMKIARLGGDEFACLCRAPTMMNSLIKFRWKY